MMRKLLFIFFFCTMRGVTHGDVLPIVKYGGLNSDYSPLTYDSQTPDSENVVTDIDSRIQGRQGFVKISTNTSTALWTFPKSDGTKYLISIVDGILKASTDNGLTFNTSISTVPTDRTVAGTSLGDAFYFSDTKNGLKSWNGTTVSVSSASMKFSILTTFKGRLVGAGQTGNLRTIYLSAYLNASPNWTLQTNPVDTDPTQIQISGPLDEIITALYPFQDKIMAFKAHHFGALSGSRRSNFAYYTYSDVTGCSLPECIQDCDGKLRWLSSIREMWEFDGTNYQRISDTVTSLFKTVSQGDISYKSFTETSPTDFGSGSFDTSVYADTETVPGSVQMTFPDTFDSYRDGSGGTKQVWHTYKTITGNGTVSTSGGNLNITNNGGTLGSVGSWCLINNFNSSTVTAKVIDMPSDSGYLSEFYLVFDPSLIPPNNPDSYGEVILMFLSTSTGKIQLVDVQGNIPAKTLIPAQFSLPATIKIIYRDNLGHFNIFINNTQVAYGTSWWTPSTPLYAYLGYLKGTSGAGTLQLDDFGVNPQTMTFTSQTHYIPAISAFSSLDSSYQLNGGTISYKVCTSSDSLMNPESCVSNQAGSTILVATNTYVRIKNSFSITNATQTPTLSDETVNWIEGSTIKAASAFSNRRYWLSIAISSTANNKIFVYDRTGQWQRYSGLNAAALVVHNSNLYFGNANGTFLAESGYNDNGAPIVSYYKTPALAPSGLDLYSKFNFLYLTTDFSGSTLGTSFYINDSPTANAMGNYNMNSKLGIQNFKLPFSTNQVMQGKYVSFKWTVSGTSFWRIIAGNLYFDRDSVLE